jgi:hypothetical protein
MGGQTSKTVPIVYDTVGSATIDVLKQTSDTLKSTEQTCSLRKGEREALNYEKKNLERKISAKQEEYEQCHYAADQLRTSLKSLSEKAGMVQMISTPPERLALGATLNAKYKTISNQQQRGGDVYQQRNQNTY